jgi:hypothetical protein
MKDKYSGRKVVFYMDNAAYYKKIVGLENGTLSTLTKPRLVKTTMQKTTRCTCTSVVVVLAMMMARRE